MERSKNQRSKYEGKNIRTLIRNLGCQNEIVRRKARASFVAMGEKSVDFLMEAVLATNPNLLLHDSVFSVEEMRKEALLTLIDIADPAAAPLFFYALEDKDSTVRWLGEEGFIALGEKGLIFLLHSLQKVSVTEELRKSMHHIFVAFSKKTDYPGMSDLLNALESPAKTKDKKVAVAAERLLNRTEKKLKQM